MCEARFLGFIDGRELNRRIKVRLNDLAAADHGITGQDYTFIHLYVFVDSCSGLHNAITVDDHVVADQRVDNSAVVMDLCIIPDYTPLDSHILTNHAIGADN